MNILDAILNAQDGAAVPQLGRQFGLEPEQTQSALAALVPALAAGLQRNMMGGGLEGLATALSTGGHERYVNDPGSLTDAATTADGNGILGHIFGTKDVSRQVAQRAADQTGIDATILKRMLPLVAALAMGGLSRQTTAAGAGSGAPGGPASLMAMLSPLLDQNRDGSIADDVIGMAGRFFGQRPGTS